MKLLLVFFALVGLATCAPQPFSLMDDLMDFVKLIPVDKIREISKNHLKTDEQFREVIRYLQGSEWQGIVKAVQANPNWQELRKYLSDTGLPVDVFLKIVHDSIKNIDAGKGPVDGKGTLRGFLDEVKAIIPKDKLKAMLDDKMKNSADFKQLYAKLSSAKTRQLVETVRKLPEVQRIAEKFESMGVHVKEALAKVYAWLGWGKPLSESGTMPMSLMDDLKDFLSLIPLDKIREIAKKHLKDDEQFREVVRYLQGSEWQGIVKAVQSNPNWQELRKYLSDAGLPVDVFLKVVHDFIKNTDAGKGPADGKGTLRGFLDEVKAVIPKDKLKAMLDDKMKNSADFKQLYAKLSSDKTRQLVETVRKLPEVQRIAEKLEKMGVHLKEALAKVYAWLGWGKPNY